MDYEIQLISDGDGLAVIGNATDVERFLASEGLSSRELGLQRLKSVARTGAVVAKAGSEIAANSGRWVKLTRESAHLYRKYGLMESKTPGVSYAMVGKPGAIKSWLQVVKGPGARMTNPAVLAGVAGIMAQVAMQQAMDEITDYLARIDEKVDDVLRAQKDAVLADMIGVEMAIEEAMTIWGQVGRVSEVTWSKVQGASTTIARIQSYAVLQLDALAEKMERKAAIGDLAKTAKEAESTVREWLAVLARCVQLQDAIAIIELDRVLDASPDELDRHRLGLKSARQKRLERIVGSTERLLARMDAAAQRANTEVLLHPAASPAVVQSRNHVVAGIDDFHRRLGIESGRESSEARRWVDAVAQARDRALEAGAKGIDVVRALGTETLERATAVKDKVVGGIAERARRPRGDDEDGAENG